MNDQTNKILIAIQKKNFLEDRISIEKTDTVSEKVSEVIKVGSGLPILSFQIKAIEEAFNVECPDLELFYMVKRSGGGVAILFWYDIP